MKTFLTDMPALPVAIGVSAGIAVTVTFGTPWWTAVALIVAGIAVVFLKKWWSASLGRVLIGLGLGIIVTGFHLPRPLSPELQNKTVTLCGRVVSVRSTDLSTRLIVEHEYGRTLVNWHGSDGRLRPGVMVTVEGRSAALDSVADLPCLPDFNRYLFSEGVNSRMTVYSHDGLVVDDSNPGWFDRISDDMRAWWLSAIVGAGFGEKTTTFLLATLGGDNLLLDDDLEVRFRDNGLAHLLAISGLHLALIVMVMAAMLGFLKLSFRTRRLYFLLLMVAVGLYAVVTGMSPSVCRAALMAWVMLGCGIYEIRPQPWQSLSVSVVVILLVKPLWLFSPAFQLSVAAVAGVITFGRLTDRVPQRYKAVRILTDVCLLPVVALISTMVLTIFYFHSFPVNFWVANVVSAVFIPPLLAVGFVTVVIATIGISFTPGTWLTDWIFQLMNRAVEAVVGPVGEGSVTVFLEDTEIVLVALSVIGLGYLVMRPGKISLSLAVIAVLVTVTVISISSRELPKAELYIPRHPRSTDLIIVDDGRAYLWTISCRNELENNSGVIAQRYDIFFRNRRTGIPEVLPDTFDGRVVARRGDVLTLGSRVLGIVRNDSTVPAVHLNYAIIDGNYRGMTDSLAVRLDADSVIIPRELNSRIAERLERELTERGFACRRLVARPLSIIVD